VKGELVSGHREQDISGVAHDFIACSRKKEERSMVESELTLSSHHAKDLVGTWTLVSVVAERDGRKFDSYGPNAKGLLMFDANGRYSIIFIAAGLPKFVSGIRSSGTADENKAVVGLISAPTSSTRRTRASRFRSTARHFQIGRARTTSAPLSSSEMSSAL
jgi:hypothetical protein